MADYTQYQSSGSLYNFSKGPKSLYFGLGDQDLLGVIFNIPQTDQDDEWGGTDRIALERLTDYVSLLWREMDDPAGGGINGVRNRLSNIISTTVKPITISYPFIDMSTPSLRMEDVTISGFSNSIAIGSTFTLTGNQLTFSGAAITAAPVAPAFKIYSPTTNSYALGYYGSDVRLFYNSSGGASSVIITTDSVSYTFSSAALTVGTLSVSNLIGNPTISTSASITFKNLYAIDSTSNIGSPSLNRVNYLYLNNLDLSSSPVTLTVNNTGLTYAGAPATITANIGLTGDLNATGNIVATGNITGNIYYGSIISLGSHFGVDSGSIIMEVSNFVTMNTGSNSLSTSSTGLTYTGTAVAINSPTTITGTLNVTGQINSNVALRTAGTVYVGSRIERTATNVDIGVSGQSFFSLYIQNILLYSTFDGTAFNVGAGGLTYTSTAGATFTTTVTINGTLTVSDYFSVGSSIYVAPTYITSYVTHEFQDIQPRNDGAEHSIGGENFGFENIYGRNIICTSNPAHYGVTGDIYSVAWVDVSSTTTATGFAVGYAVYAHYKKVGKRVFFDFYVIGTSNSGSVTVKLPAQAKMVANYRVVQATYSVDNGIEMTTPGMAYLYGSDTDLAVYKTWETAPAAPNRWTSSGTKVVIGNISYESQL